MGTFRRLHALVTPLAQHGWRFVLAVILSASGLLDAPPSYADHDTDWIPGAMQALRKAQHDWDAEDVKQASPR